MVSGWGIQMKYLVHKKIPSILQSFERLLKYLGIRGPNSQIGEGQMGEFLEQKLQRRQVNVKMTSYLPR